MCTTDNIKLLINPITFLKLILALYVCIVGIQFASTDFLHKAYGDYFISAGVGIFFMGFFSGFVCVSVVVDSFLVIHSNTTTVHMSSYRFHKPLGSKDIINFCFWFVF